MGRKRGRGYTTSKDRDLASQRESKGTKPRDVQYAHEKKNFQARDENRVIAEDITWTYEGHTVEKFPGSERMISAVLDATQYPQARCGEFDDESIVGIAAERMYKQVFKMPIYKVSAYYLYPHNVSIVLTHNNSILTKYVPTFLELFPRIVRY